MHIDLSRARVPKQREESVSLLMAEETDAHYVPRSLCTVDIWSTGMAISYSLGRRRHWQEVCSFLVVRFDIRWALAPQAQSWVKIAIQFIGSETPRQAI